MGVKGLTQNCLAEAEGKTFQKVSKFFLKPIGQSAASKWCRISRLHSVYFVAAGLVSPQSKVLRSRNNPAASLMRLNSIQNA